METYKDDGKQTGPHINHMKVYATDFELFDEKLRNEWPSYIDWNYTFKNIGNLHFMQKV